ncbi:MAG: triphosphoribosyl-dephospho-CoA synthase CitG [Lachnospiraceae bacterium]|nr:triphosphoribosyl-dephospho-CoA synthase CitG [Lachnospiraceae bacterium]
MEYTKVNVNQMLAARDRRAARQAGLLSFYKRPMVSFTMNIAGPVKNTPLIRRGFREGNALLRAQLRRLGAACLFSETLDEPTGLEAYYVIDAPAEKLKELTLELEETSRLGRLFDMDVLAPDGEKLARPKPRRCLICGLPVQACARSRAHSVPELQEKTRELLLEGLREKDLDTAASLALRALLYEVATTPKPGLVDRGGSGSHKDMDFFTFLDSSSVLYPYFRECAASGMDTKTLSPPETLKALRPLGKLAEGRMLEATGGINTHKGAIFSVGILCGALGRLDRELWADPARVLSEAAAMAAGITGRELAGLKAEDAGTSGSRLFLKYGISGVRGQAEAGFPSVLSCGLPVLEEGLAAGRSIDEAGSAALLALLARTPDTNMIARGGLEAAEEAKARAQELLSRSPYPDADTIRELDRVFISQNLSPGGCADLLALTYLLHFLRESGES